MDALEVKINGQKNCLSRIQQDPLDGSLETLNIVNFLSAFIADFWYTAWRAGPCAVGWVHAQDSPHGGGGEEVVEGENDEHEESRNY